MVKETEKDGEEEDNGRQKNLTAVYEIPGVLFFRHCLHINIILAAFRA